VDGVVPGPFPEALPPDVEDDSGGGEEEVQGGNGHDGADVADLVDPDVQELAHAVAPQVLVDSGGYQELARDVWVRVNLDGGKCFSR
jgi:hypothetical protein